MYNCRRLGIIELSNKTVYGGNNMRLTKKQKQATDMAMKALNSPTAKKYYFYAGLTYSVKLENDEDAKFYAEAFGSTLVTE